jgi:hypothetical protein
VADLTIAIGLINVYNRVAIGFRRAPRRSRASESLWIRPRDTPSFWTMDRFSRLESPRKIRRPLPIIGVRRVIMQCGAMMIVLRLLSLLGLKCQCIGISAPAP